MSNREEVHMCNVVELAQVSLLVSETHCQGFSLGTPVSSPPSSVNGFSQ